MKKVQQIIALMFLILSFYACKSDMLENPVEGRITPNADSMRYFTEGFVHFTYSANELTISFHSSTDWRVDIGSNNWIEVNPRLGNAGDATLSIKIKENTTKNERQTHITIGPREQGNAIGFKIIQDAPLYFNLSTNAIEAMSWGQRVGTEVETNMDYYIEIEETANKWLKYTGRRSTESSSRHNFIVEENKGMDHREGKIFFKNELNTEVLTIMQDVAYDENELISFEDDYIKTLCIELWDTNNDGELSYKEAANVTDLGIEWQYDGLRYFDEFKFFKQVEVVPPFFFAYSSLEYISLPHSVTTIEEGAFANCDGLIDIALSDGLTTINEGAFYGCGNIKTISCYAETPPNIVNDNMGEGLNPDAIYVPDECVDAYKNAKGWAKYASVIRSIK